MRWVDAPLQDSPPATVFGGLEMIWRAVLCRVLGHEWMYSERALWDTGAWRYCMRCALNQRPVEVTG